MSQLPAIFNVRSHKYLILALIVFTLLSLPFIGSVPYLDGNIDFVKAHDFYKGSLSTVLNDFRSTHPPVKEIASSIFFLIGGVNSVSYGLIGFILGILGIIFFSSVARLTTDKSVSNISTLLLASSPLFVSTGIFALTDYILTVLIIASVYFYTKQKYILYAICASLAALTKETGIVFALSVLAVEIITSKEKIKKIIIGIIPIISFIGWFAFLKINGQSFWSDWNFSETASRGTVFTILNNVITLNIFNKYAYQNWLQLFFLNFNWIFWPIALIGAATLLKSHQNNKKILVNKTWLIILVFCVTYFILVLSFQTYTIPRYALPFEPFFLTAVALGVSAISRKFKTYKYPIYLFLFAIILIRLFTSIDPISIRFWGKANILGQNFYGLNNPPSLSGFDGITYNLQYNLAVYKRTNIIYNKDSDLEECSWVFPDLNNDFKTIEILGLKDNPCI